MRPPIAPTVLGSASAAGTAALYAVGLHRAYDYDGGVTVKDFIATPSLLDPLRYQNDFNNHPLFSLLDHVIYTGGGHSEAALRLLPILFASAAVGLLAWWCAARWGLLAGAAAAAALAANPLVSELSREVRGYSLMLLAVLVSTMLLERLLERPGRWTEATYVLAVAAAIATHLHGGLVLAGHVVAVLATRQMSRRWIARWAIGVTLGLLFYVQIYDVMAASSGGDREFRLHYPYDLLHEMLGRHAVAVLLMAVPVAVGLWALRHQVAARAGALAIAAVLAALWLLYAPHSLYPRYEVWLAPAFAVAAAAGVARARALMVPVVAAVAVMLATDVPDWTTPQIPGRAAAAYVDWARAHGEMACSIGYVWDMVRVYTASPREVSTVTQLEPCGLVMAIPKFAIAEPVRRAAARTLGHHQRLDGRWDIEVYSRLPLPAPGELERAWRQNSHFRAEAAALSPR